MKGDETKQRRLQELLQAFEGAAQCFPCGHYGHLMRLHAIEATFDQCESLLCRVGFFIRLVRRQAANKMMLLRDCISGS